jgi:hypothetical protein
MVRLGVLYIAALGRTTKMETIISASGGERTKRLFYGLFCLGVGLVALWGHGYIIGILGLIGGVSLLMPGSGTLELDEKGFAYKTLVGQKRVEWASVDSFVMVTYRSMGVIAVSRKVGWRFAKTHKRSTVAKAAGALVAFDGVLPDNYGMKPAELAALLEARRRRALGLESNAQPDPSAWK